jgi:hypothetical protein
MHAHIGDRFVPTFRWSGKNRKPFHGQTVERDRQRDISDADKNLRDRGEVGIVVPRLKRQRGRIEPVKQSAKNQEECGLKQNSRRRTPFFVQQNERGDKNEVASGSTISSIAMKPPSI